MSFVFTAHYKYSKD